MSTNMHTLLAQLNVSYRQLDYWVRKGYLQPRHNGGTGHYREFIGDELMAAHRMARLVNVGFTPDAAARIARAVDRTGHVDLGLGIQIHIGDGGVA